MLLVTMAFAPLANAQRVALLIGNSSYQTAPLRNPPNDVREMESALTAIGFKVQKVLNANQNQMKRAVRDFGALAQGADVAFLYYSGHGTQASGENYLLPVGAIIDKESDYEVEAVSANALMRQIAGARPKAAIVVLDACRDNPYASATKSTSKGLTRMDAPTGSMIAFATAPNTTASDEGLYARELARQITTPGVELYDVFRNTTAEVQRLSKGKQVPRVSEVSITEKIYLAGQAGVQLASARAEPVPTRTPNEATAEAALWAEVARTNNADDYQAYLSQYPRGAYVALANGRMKKLQDEQTARQEEHKKAEAAEQNRIAEQQRKEREEAAKVPEWALSDNGSDINWSEATQYCASKGTGWRLPTVAELQSIYDPAQSQYCGRYTCHVAPKFHLTSFAFWTKEQQVSSNAAFVYLDDGKRVVLNIVHGKDQRALCVRQS